MPRPPLPPSSRRKAVQGAVMLAVTLLQDERVREQLRRAPAAARTWAEHRRVATSAANADAIDTTATDITGTRKPGTGSRTTAPGVIDAATSRLDVTQRFGQKGLERRLAALRRNIGLAFPEPLGPDALAIDRAVDELDRATAIAATMTGRDRRRAQSRISAELGRLETALVEAVLPPDDHS